MIEREVAERRAPMSDAKRLLRSVLLYLVPTVLLRGLSVIMTPIYTRALVPDEYAVLGVSNAVFTALSTVLGLGLQGALLRLYADRKNDRDRRRMLGAVMACLFTIPVVAALALDLAGRAGSLDVFQILPFRPHGQLVLVASVASVYSAPLTTLYQAQERPVAYGTFSLATGLGQIAATLVLVVGLDRGALGALEAICITQCSSGLVAIVLTLRQSDFTFDAATVRAVLGFSLPLVPHYVTNWALALSDRLILERHVLAEELGLYSLAYLFHLAVGMASGAMTQTLYPIVMRRLAADPRDVLVPRLGTYAIAIVFGVALTFYVLARDAMRIVADSSYAGAIQYVGWLILGAAFHGVYSVWSLGTWFSRRTQWMPFVAAVVAGLTVAMNLAFVPRFGALAASVVTALSYALLALAHGALQRALFPIPWEYARWAKLAVAALPAVLLAEYVGSFPAAVRLGVGVLAVLVIWPATFAALGGTEADEIARVKAHLVTAMSWRRGR